MNLSEYKRLRKQQILAILKEIILRNTRPSGSESTPVDGLHLVRKNETTCAKHCFSQPMALLAIQGSKSLDFGAQKYIIAPGQCVVICLESPCASYIIDASRENPFLSIHFDLDAKILADLLTEMSPETRPKMKTNFNAHVIDASLEFMETFLRIASLLNFPSQIEILAPLILRELHYLLLVGPAGELLHKLYMRGARDNRIIDAISWLKKNIGSPIAVDSLARKVNMSVSSLHRQFKIITGCSPLQYQKKLMLCEAQRLMLAENERADIAALSVGYESISQFNREYKRMFGAPPRRDVRARKKDMENNGKS